MNNEANFVNNIDKESGYNEIFYTGFKYCVNAVKNYYFSLVGNNKMTDDHYLRF